MNQKEWVLLVALWVLTTAAGIALVLVWEIFPSPGSREALIIDSAMTLLTVLSVPIFTSVVIVLVYSMIRFRQRGEPTGDGPPIQGNLKIEIAWVAASLALVLFLAGYGSMGLLEIRAHAASHGDGHGDELVVQVQGNQWFWEFYYPAQGIRTKDELRLPVGRPVRFEITSNDVVHSFWVPAFRTKIDAVPGLVTIVNATPTHKGTFQEDHNFRVQCAELCGLGHGAMETPVVLVEPDGFETWVAQQPKSR